MGIRRIAARSRSKSDTFSSCVGRCLVCVNNKVSPTCLRVEGNRCCENIISIILSIECLAIEEGWHRAGEIPTDSMQLSHLFLVLNRMFRHFRWFFVRPKPDLLAIDSKIEPRFIEGHNELPIFTFD
jgi:hypothetical protein